MGTVDKLLFYIFVLSALLIAVVYYVGVKTDVGAFSQAGGYLGNVFTGRNPSTGQFANYPGQSK